MIAMVVVNKLKSFLLVFVSLFRRALCCFRRRRRSSCDAVPLTHVGVVSDIPDSSNPNDVESWNDWGDNKPKTVQDHIEMYRKQVYSRNAVNEELEEEQQNFFEDMVPKITKPNKLYINTKSDNKTPSNRLNFNGDSIAIMPNSELGEWDENSGWEGEKLDWEAQEALREKKRQERERRLWEQQQKRQEKMGRSLGARISS